MKIAQCAVATLNMPVRKSLQLREEEMRRDQKLDDLDTGEPLLVTFCPLRNTAISGSPRRRLNRGRESTNPDKRCCALSSRQKRGRNRPLARATAGRSSAQVRVVHGKTVLTVLRLTGHRDRGHFSIPVCRKSVVVGYARRRRSTRPAPISIVATTSATSAMLDSPPVRGRAAGAAGGVVTTVSTLMFASSPTANAS